MHLHRKAIEQLIDIDQETYEASDERLDQQVEEFLNKIYPHSKKEKHVSTTNESSN